VAALKDGAPVKVTRTTSGTGLLELEHCDMHFGNSDFAWYADTLQRTLNLVRSRKWDQVVVPIGSDLFHTDNFKNATSNGTVVSSMDWPAAWADAATFYATIIEAALKHSAELHLYYIIGNHDESMAWAFCQMLAVKYPQVRFDLDISERKVHVWNDVAIGIEHDHAVLLTTDRNGRHVGETACVSDCRQQGIPPELGVDFGSVGVLRAPLPNYSTGVEVADDNFATLR
jgi:hypothetical protein